MSLDAYRNRAGSNASNLAQHQSGGTRKALNPACVIPAVRAARLPPTHALRSE